MQKQKTLSLIFQNEPSRWGLRGDPYLWKEIKTLLEDRNYPDTEEELLDLLEKTYEQLTGKSIKDQLSMLSVLIERYEHGGMSSGRVSPQFWIETGIPLLRARYNETK